MASSASSSARGGERRVADGGGVQEQRLRAGDADGHGVVVAARRARSARRPREPGDGEVEVGARDRRGCCRARSATRSSATDSTSPCAGPSCSPRRPSRSVRPASACSKKRFCSSVSPRITRSILAWRALAIASTRGRQRSTNACASRRVLLEDRARRGGALARRRRAPARSASADGRRPVRRSPSATQESCVSSRLMMYW